MGLRSFISLRSQEVAPYAQGFVGDADRLATLLDEARQRANRVHRFGNDNRLVIHLVGVISLMAVDGEHIFPERNFIHISARSAEIVHQLNRAIERHDPFLHPDKGDARRSPKGLQHIIAAGVAREFHNPEVISVISRLAHRNSSTCCRKTGSANRLSSLSRETVCRVTQGLCVNSQSSGSSRFHISSVEWLHDKCRSKASSTRESNPSTAGGGKP